MILKQYYVERLSHASYLIADERPATRSWSIPGVTSGTISPTSSAATARESTPSQASDPREGKTAWPSR